jgi:hypothetical protein
MWEFFRRKARAPQKVTTGRFEIEQNGEVAFLEYSLAGNILEISDTEIPKKLRHRCACRYARASIRSQHSLQKIHSLPNRSARKSSGSETIDLSYFGINHERGNIFIYAPRLEDANAGGCGLSGIYVL